MVGAIGRYGYGGASIARITQRANNFAAQGTFYNYSASRRSVPGVRAG